VKRKASLCVVLCENVRIYRIFGSRPSFKYLNVFALISSVIFIVEVNNRLWITPVLQTYEHSCTSCFQSVCYVSHAAQLCGNTYLNISWLPWILLFAYCPPSSFLSHFAPLSLASSSSSYLLFYSSVEEDIEMVSFFSRSAFKSLRFPQFFTSFRVFVFLHLFGSSWVILFWVSIPLSGSHNFTLFFGFPYTIPSFNALFLKCTLQGFGANPQVPESLTKMGCEFFHS